MNLLVKDRYFSKQNTKIGKCSGKEDSPAPGWSEKGPREGWTSSGFRTVMLAEAGRKSLKSEYFKGSCSSPEETSYV